MRLFSEGVGKEKWSQIQGAEIGWCWQRL